MDAVLIKLAPLSVVLQLSWWSLMHWHTTGLSGVAVPSLERAPCVTLSGTPRPERRCHSQGPLMDGS